VLGAVGRREGEVDAVRVAVALAPHAGDRALGLGVVARELDVYKWVIQNEEDDEHRQADQEPDHAEQPGHQHGAPKLLGHGIGHPPGRRANGDWSRHLHHALTSPLARGEWVQAPGVSAGHSEEPSRPVACPHSPRLVDALS
jgi:hypothetical protein